MESSSNSINFMEKPIRLNINLTLVPEEMLQRQFGSTSLGIAEQAVAYWQKLLPCSVFWNVPLHLGVKASLSFLLTPIFHHQPAQEGEGEAPVRCSENAAYDWQEDAELVAFWDTEAEGSYEWTNICIIIQKTYH